MLIDWFTVAAQAINFLILVWLLKRFLYQPILDAIDAREQHIASALADADAKQAEANNERQTFQQKNEEFDNAHVARLKQVSDEAEAERQRLFEEAHEAADALSAKRQQSLDAASGELVQAVGQRTQHEVIAIARKALGDLAGASLEERIADVFTQRLRALNEASRARLAEAVQTASGPALLRSAFDLSPEARAAIQRSVNESLQVEVPMRFETAPQLVGGVELLVQGQKIGWSIADYLTRLEESLEGLITGQQPGLAARAKGQPPTSSATKDG